MSGPPLGLLRLLHGPSFIERCWRPRKPAFRSSYVGQYVVVLYDTVGARTWHQRFLCRFPRYPGDYCVVSPDFDVYLEQLAQDTDDFRDFDVLATSGWPTAAAQMTPMVGEVYFRLPGAALAAPRFPITALHGDVAVYTFLWTGILRPPRGPPAMPAGMMAGSGPITLEADLAWLVAEDDDVCNVGVTLGQEVHPGVCDLHTEASRGVLPHAGNMILINHVKRTGADPLRTRDLRLLPIKDDVRGRRRRAWSSALKEKGVVMSDRPVGGGWSWQDLCARRVDVLKEAFRIDGSPPNHSWAAYPTGCATSSPGVTVAPSLTLFVAASLRDDAAVSNEVCISLEDRSARGGAEGGGNDAQGARAAGGGGTRL